MNICEYCESTVIHLEQRCDSYFWSKNLLSIEMFQSLKMANNDFYLRYYVGHKGKFGHEFLEFEFRPDGKLRWVWEKVYSVANPIF